MKSNNMFVLPHLDYELENWQAVIERKIFVREVRFMALELSLLFLHSV